MNPLYPRLGWSLIVNVALVICHSGAGSREDRTEVERGEWGRQSQGENVNKGSKAWALLVAGTNGWSFYRHQANICHAYQTLVEKYKMPKDRIITMFYDDVANDPRNPNPGVLINEPNGTNVYENVGKDYTGDDVSLSNLYKIIKGDKKGMVGTGSGKVIEPDPQNRVFIYFTGTGGKGGFSTILRETIWADDFTKTLIELKKNKKLKETLIYWESSHSGAMFETYLPFNSGILAMTSAASSEDSFGYYCNIDGMSVCLAGHFSINWITDAKQKSAPKETIFEHFNAVRLGVTSSHPNLYGSYRLGLRKLPYFFGGKKVSPNDWPEEISLPDLPVDFSDASARDTTQEEKSNGVAEAEIPIVMLEGEIKSAKSLEEKTRKEAELVSLKKKREFLDETMDSILKHSIKEPVTETRDSSFVRHRRCFKKLAIQFQKTCFNNSNYYVNHILSKLFKICEADAEEEGLKAISEICTTLHRSLDNVI